MAFRIVTVSLDYPSPGLKTPLCVPDSKTDSKCKSFSQLTYLCLTGLQTPFSCSLNTVSFTEQAKQIKNFTAYSFT